MRAGLLIGASVLALAGCSLEIPDFRKAPAVTPQPVNPVALPQSAKSRFITTVAANGCEVNSSNSAQIMEAATLSVEDLARIMTELKADGQGRIADDGAAFRLTTGACG